MSNYVNDMWPGSPQKDSPSTSGSDGSSRLSSRSGSRSSSRGSRFDSRSSSRSPSASRSRPRRRSRSRRRHQRKYRRYSRSFSRSRSGSRRRRYRERRPGPPRRYFRSPSPRGPRSRSRGRSGFGRSPCVVVRARRHHGPGRAGHPEGHGRWRERSPSRTRSRSRTPLRLSEKERMELLEIAKANAAKALGTTNFELPACLRTVSVAKETNHGAAVAGHGTKFELSEKLTDDGTKNSSEKSSQQRNIAFSSNNSVAKPMQKTNTTGEERSSGSPKIDKKKSPYGLWIPV